MVIEVEASAKIVSAVASVAKSTWSWLGRYSMRRTATDALNELLGVGLRTDTCFRIGVLHSTLERGSVHPDDAAAFATIAGPSLAHAMQSDWLLLDEVAGDLESNVVVIGSPGSEGLSRLIFGYQESSDHRLQYTGTTLDLPYRWEEDRAEVSASCLRMQPDGHTSRRPNWPIVDARHGLSLRPRTNNEGFLTSDYLLVTKLPNFLTASGNERGRTILSVGGSHGVATRAVEHLFSQPELAAELLRRHHGAPAPHFQALFEARSVVHSARLGSTARRLVLVDYVPLTFTDQAIHLAHRAAAERFTDWMRETEGRGIEPRRGVDPLS